MRAEIRAGELLAEMKVRGERHNRETNLREGPKSPAATSVPTLSDLGITKTQSSRMAWRALARVVRARRFRILGCATAFVAVNQILYFNMLLQKRRNI
jgi:hypothetical protein